MEKRINISLLLSFYGPLLTARQRQILLYHHEDDLSLSEIAQLLGMTRQAAHDAIRRGENQLARWEEKLQLHARWAHICARLLLCRRHLQNGDAQRADLVILSLLEEEQAGTPVADEC